MTVGINDIAQNGGLPSSLSSDGTHPNKDGYTIMEDVVLPSLQAYPAE